MAKITREQIRKINNNCKNGWELDLRYFLYHSEKTLKKIIELDSEHYLEFKLDYNYKNQITLRISKFYYKEDEYFATSNGLGKNKILNETQATRKNINNLIEFTNSLTDDECMRINAETPVTKSCIFVESEDF